MKNFKHFILAIHLVWIFFLQAQQIPKQGKDTFAYDYAGVLSASEVITLDNTLRKFRDSTQHKLVLVIVENLQGYEIEEFTNAWFNDWKIGKEGYNNGVLLMVSQQDRKVRIEVGYGLEAALTDVQSDRIIEEIIVPAFKSNNPYDGLSRAVYAIINQIQSSGNAPTIDGEKHTSFSYTRTWLGGDTFTYVFPAIFFALAYIVAGVLLFRKGKTTFKNVALYFLMIIGAYFFLMLLIDFIALQYYDTQVVMDFTEIFGEYVFVRLFVAVLYGLFMAIPGGVVLIFIKGIFFSSSDSSNSYSSSSSSSSYSDYSDSSSSYSDYSDSSYSDYSDYSDSGGSSGGGGASGSW
ncbi:MAG: TPM domain-containing protein [Cytophagaceae bacterium]|jgi:uncharacterized protein|nr:TPM domain-containing protein [Cytophagaceae bacterium]